MSNKVKVQIKVLHRATKKATASKAASLKFLKEAGIIVTKKSTNFVETKEILD